MASDRDTLAELLSARQRCCPSFIRARGDAEAIIEAGWRPPVQVIETHEELDALPVGTVVMDSPYPDGDVHQKLGEGQWFEPGFDPAFTTRVLSLPAVVLWSPTEKAGQ